MPPDAFDTECDIEISSLHRLLSSPDSLSNLGDSFFLRSSTTPMKGLGLSFRVAASDVQDMGVADSCFFFELQQGTLTRVVPATVRETGNADGRGYAIEALAKLAKNNVQYPTCPRARVDHDCGVTINAGRGKHKSAYSCNSAQFLHSSLLYP